MRPTKVRWELRVEGLGFGVWGLGLGKLQLELARTLFMALLTPLVSTHEASSMATGQLQF